MVTPELPPAFELSALDARAVTDLAHRLGRASAGGEIILLQGPLGAGKTYFTRGFAEAIGIPSGVSSPTYVLHCAHRSPRGLTLHHLDFYRLNDEAEAEDLGLEELSQRDSVVIVEWPDRCPDAFEAYTLKLGFEIEDETHRKISGWWGPLPFDRQAFPR